MEVKFVVNDYMLAWALLYQASISKEIQEVKTRLWENDRKAYGKIAHDDKLLLLDYKNFIPDDDTIYDALFQTKVFQGIKKETEKYRLLLLETYDQNKKELAKELTNIVRMEFKNYDFLTLHPELDYIDTVKVQDKKNALAWGRVQDTKDPITFLTDLAYVLVRLAVGNYQAEHNDLVDAIVELATLDELATRITGVSHYLEGRSELLSLKKQIYPYWLMYLGADQEKMLSYMMRDKIAFDVDKYPVEKHLAKVDLLGFIDFCVKHQSYMERVQEMEVLS